MAKFNHSKGTVTKVIYSTNPGTKYKAHKRRRRVSATPIRKAFNPSDSSSSAMSMSSRGGSSSSSSSLGTRSKHFKKLFGQNRGPITGKLGGKVRPKKRTPRGRNVADLTTETVFNLSDGNCIYLGHAMYAPKPIWKTFILSLLRESYIRFGIPAIDFTDLRSQGTLSIAFDGYADENSITKTTLCTVVYDFAATPRSLEAVADNYIGLNSVSNIFEHAFGNRNARYTEIVMAITDDAGSFNPIEYNLSSMKVNLQMRSHFKIQNRTVSESASVSTDVVDKNPISGYLYKTKGGLLTLKGDRKVKIAPNINHGLIGAAAAGAAALTEPPKPWQVSKCVRYKKINITPGEIKTSVMRENYSVPFFKFLNFTRTYAVASTVFGERNPGYGQIFALEKTLDEIGSTDVVNAFVELNNNYVMSFRYNNRSYINPIKRQVAP